MDDPTPTTGGGPVPVLRLQGVHKRFAARRVLAGVDLDIQSGEILALVGENGAGKSTLVHCVARSYPADAGTFEIAGLPLAPDAIGVRGQGVAIVWQDLALCDNLSVVANLFLGAERLDRMLLDEATMAAEAWALFERLGISITHLFQPVGSLSGGQRQLVAMARAVMQEPAILMLDEPTAALGVAESRLVDSMLERLRAAGAAVLLISHRLEQVFNVADRIAVLRDGRIVADVSPLEVHPDDVVAMISGIEADSTARRQLRRLRSLVDQLAEAGPAASLPLIVSAMAEALGVDQLCVHLLDQPEGAEPRLRRSAAVGLRAPLLEAVESLPIGEAGGPPGMAAATGHVVVVEDARHDPRWRPFRSEDRRGGPRSTWSVPITGTVGVLGTISGYAGTVGRPQADQLELVSLYASHAAAAIDRERLLADATRRNRVLETLRGVLDSLAGPLPAHRGLAVALRALGQGLGADAIAFHAPTGEQSDYSSQDGSAVPAVAVARQRAAASALLATSASGPAGDALPGQAPSLAFGAGVGGPVTSGVGLSGPGGRSDAGVGAGAFGGDGLTSGSGVAPPSGNGAVHRAERIGVDVLAVPIGAPNGLAVVTAWWADPARLSGDALGLLDDAARSLRLALEREALEGANAEAASLRRTQRVQREFLFRLNHELRTPLTAIQGFASTLRQPDVSWDSWSQDRFLDSIASESVRMGRLVGDLLDFNAIDSGDLRLVRDWCELGLVLQAARGCVAEAPDTSFVLADCSGLPPIWADHDRLEQVFVNLLENAVRHAIGLTRVEVSAELDPTAGSITVRVIDDGVGIALDPAERLFIPHERGPTDGPGAGLGLAIARGIVEAHGGTIGFEPVASGTAVAVTLPVEPDGAGYVEHVDGRDGGE